MEIRPPCWLAGSVNLLHPGCYRCDISEFGRSKKCHNKTDCGYSLDKAVTFAHAAPGRRRKVGDRASTFCPIAIIWERIDRGACRVRSCQRLQKLNARSMSLQSHVSPTSRASSSAEIRSLTRRIDRGMARLQMDSPIGVNQRVLNGALTTEKYRGDVRFVEHDSCDRVWLPLVPRWIKIGVPFNRDDRSSPYIGAAPLLIVEKSLQPTQIYLPTEAVVCAQLWKDAEIPSQASPSRGIICRSLNVSTSPKASWATYS